MNTGCGDLSKDRTFPGVGTMFSLFRDQLLVDSAHNDAPSVEASPISHLLSCVLSTDNSDPRSPNTSSHLVFHPRPISDDFSRLGATDNALQRRGINTFIVRTYQVNRSSHRILGRVTFCDRFAQMVNWRFPYHKSRHSRKALYLTKDMNQDEAALISSTSSPMPWRNLVLLAH